MALKQQTITHKQSRGRWRNFLTCNIVSLPTVNWWSSWRVRGARLVLTGPIRNITSCLFSHFPFLAIILSYNKNKQLQNISNSGFYCDASSAIYASRVPGCAEIIVDAQCWQGCHPPLKGIHSVLLRSHKTHNGKMRHNDVEPFPLLSSRGKYCGKSSLLCSISAHSKAIIGGKKS